MSFQLSVIKYFPKQNYQSFYSIDKTNIYYLLFIKEIKYDKNVPRTIKKNVINLMMNIKFEIKFNFNKLCNYKIYFTN